MVYNINAVLCVLKLHSFLYYPHVEFIPSRMLLRIVNFRCK
jgi:hypothetical protein